MPGIWGDGQRGGIFGAKVDPRLQAELERRAIEKRQMAQGLESAGKAQSTIGSRAQDWWNNSTLARMADPRTSPLGPAAIARMFFDPAGEAERQVETGEQLAKPFTQFNDPRVDPVKQGADLALTVMGGSSVVPAAANELRMGIKAYHGSPHDFERFDSSKIGTGEGAQAYGHGLYFGEREAVGQEYRDKLTSRVANEQTPEGSATRALDLSNGDPQAAIETLTGNLESIHASIDAMERQGQMAPSQLVGRLSEYEDAIKLVENGFTGKGRMYEVDIAADPEHFLDWDKPLSEQSPQVRERVAKLEVGGERPIQFGELRDTFLKPMAEAIKGTEFERFVKPDDFYSGNVDMSEVRRSLAGNPDKLAKIEELQAAFQKHSALRGSDVYNTLARSYEDRIGGGLTAARDSPAVADQLRDLGIPGIKYLDQGSRGAGTGTSNFVVFDDKLISILKKYGLPISAAGLATLSQLHPQEAQAAQKKPQKKGAK